MAESAAQGFVAAIGLVATIEVVSATLPGGHIATAWRLGAIALIIAPAVLWLARSEQLRDLPEKARTRTVVIWHLVLAASCAVFAAAIWQTTTRHPHLHLGAVKLAGMALAVVFAAIVEEGCFRRVVYVAARPVFRRAAPLISAVVWACAGIGDRSVAGVGILLVAGALYAYAYERTGRWWPVAAAHAVVNVAVLLVLPAVR